jgi:hypothetical protein
VAKTKKGHVGYGGRAFHQDATDAMRGDIVRGLIEALTNSDDAYGDNSGKIRIEVEHKRGPWKVIVRDRARGMMAQRMEQAIAQLGGRTSGFEAGEDVRGNLGRGAKDLAAFGVVTFESICEDKRAKLILEPSGDYELFGDRTASDDDRRRLHIPRGNGTVVTISVTANTRCPLHGRLTETLSKHYQLRDILSDPRREVMLVDLGRDDTTTLRYSYPSLPTEFSGEVDVPGYPDVTAAVTIYRNPDRYEDPASDVRRPGGLLLKGRRAIYENTYFGLEGNPYAGWFSGRVECPYIDQLAGDYDERLVGGEPQAADNPMPIISRRRDGLQHNHPFFKALASAVEVPLKALVDAEEARAREAGGSESAEMRRTLDNLGRDLARLIDEDLRELDEEALPVGAGSGELPALQLVPEHAILYMGEEKVVSVLVRKDLEQSAVQAEVDPDGVVDLLDQTVTLKPHRRRQDLLTGQVRVRPLMEDQTLLSARCGEHSVVGVVEVRPERVVEVEELAPPEALEFERDRYQMAWGKQKKLRVQAPIESVATWGDEVRVTSSDPGVAVLGETKLALDDELELYLGWVRVEARTLGSKATLRAALGEEIDECRVAVGRDEGAPSLKIDIVNEDAGPFRARVTTEGSQQVIKIYGLHAAIRRYRGSAPDYKGEELSVTKALIAEIVADQAAHMVLERKYPPAVGEHLDAASFYAEHYHYLNKYLARCHKMLVPETWLASP